jgi:hypothetical protein
MPHLSYFLVIEEDHQESLRKPLSFAEVAALASMAIDSASNERLLALLAEHPSARVRTEVAGKDNLSDATVARLLADKSPDVIQTMVRHSRRFRSTATIEQLQALIDRDVGLAEAIASTALEFGEVDAAQLVDILLAQPDPAIHETLACLDLPGPKSRRAVLAHPDPLVAHTAVQQQRL